MTSRPHVLLSCALSLDGYLDDATGRRLIAQAKALGATAIRAQYPLGEHLEELADEFQVSRERVRQIEVRAFEKVQKAVKNRVAAMETPAALAAAAQPSMH